MCVQYQIWLSRWLFTPLSELGVSLCASYGCRGEDFLVQATRVGRLLIVLDGVHKNEALPRTFNVLGSEEAAHIFHSQTPPFQLVRMANPNANPEAQLEPLQAPGSALGSGGQPSQPSPPSQGSANHVDGWKMIGEQQGLYDEQDCLQGRNLASEKLSNRREDDVVIFNYSLDPEYLKRVDGNPLVEEGRFSPQHFSAEDDIFLQMPKDNLIESSQFNRIINPTNEAQGILAEGQRLGIM